MENKKNIIEKMKELNSLMEDFLDRMDMDECENSDEERMDEIAKEERMDEIAKEEKEGG